MGCRHSACARFGHIWGLRESDFAGFGSLTGLTQETQSEAPENDTNQCLSPWLINGRETRH